MPKYAKKTTVSIPRSRDEIQATLKRFGATAFAYGETERQAMIEFCVRDRRVRFVLPMPDPNDPEFSHCPTKKVRSPEDQHRLWEIACRQQWRSLCISIKAKLVAVESQIVSFESEFLAHIVLPDNQTVGQWMHPQIEDAYRLNRMPPMLMLPAPNGAAN